MLNEGLTPHLLWAALCLAVLAAWIAKRDLSWPWAVGLALLRFGVPVAYFAWFYDGGWNLLDDLVYFSHGDAVLDHGYNPLTVLTNPEGFGLLSSLVGGHHVLYSWWNVLAVWIFGSHYYAPILMNVLVTFVLGWLLARTMLKLGFAQSYCKWLLIFYLLHWDGIVWSSFINLKDTIVEALTVAALYCVVSFWKDHRARWLIGLGGSWFLFYWVRFYAPVLMIGAIGLWAAWQWPDPRKFILAPLLIAAMYLAAPSLREYTEMMGAQSMWTDWLRFIVTPLPWSIEADYSFLLVPSILHLALLVPAAIGAVVLWRECPGARLYLIYLLTVITFYSVTEELQGPRQRLQVSFIFVWLQFHFLRHALGQRIWAAPTARNERVPLLAYPAVGSTAAASTAGRASSGTRNPAEAA